MLISPPLLHLFGRQHGVASHRQIGEHLSPRQLVRAVDLALFVPEVPKVKRLAGTPESVESRVMALSLYAGPTGFVSGMTAARQHGVTCVPMTVLEVMIPDARESHLPSWARSTRSSWRMVSDRQELADGRIVSSSLRTLFRCAATTGDVRFEKIAEQMWHKRLITPAEAAAYLKTVRRQGRTGVTRFERWLEKAVERPRPAQSTLEIDLITKVVELGLPAPARQFPLTLPNGETIHLDAAWPNVRLGLEPGATWWHGGDERARKDSRRDRACDEVGWRILRFDEVELRDLTACGRQVMSIHRHRSRLQEFAGNGTPWG
ncbi:MAG: hypothetical protein JWL72_1548 [Ilumatobacteraceae bacterium]|nr:hypothetical protein [Ilumatobacteraceae bacterium]MCU1388210.1 hypothetical protein [Ilumatobacteraceae bacterium]